MASEKMNKFKEMSVEELKQTLARLEVEYANDKFDHAAIGLDNPLSLREKRKDIARIKTLIRQHELAQMSPEMLAKRTKIVQRRRKRR